MHGVDVSVRVGPKRTTMPYGQYGMSTTNKRMPFEIVYDTQ